MLRIGLPLGYCDVAGCLNELRERSIVTSSCPSKSGDAHPMRELIGSAVIGTIQKVRRNPDHAFGNGILWSELWLGVEFVGRVGGSRRAAGPQPTNRNASQTGRQRAVSYSDLLLHSDPHRRVQASSPLFCRTAVVIVYAKRGWRFPLRRTVLAVNWQCATTLLSFNTSTAANPWCRDLHLQCGRSAS